MNTLLRCSTLLILLAASAACARQTAGDLDLLTGDYPAAERKLAPMVAENPQDQLLRRRLAMVYFREGKFAQASEQFAAAEKLLGGLEKMEPEDQLNYGLSLIGAGQPSEGVATLQSFSYPLRYRVEQEVRAEAGKIDTSQPMPAIIAQMRRAWDRGQEQEKQERGRRRFFEGDIGFDRG